MTKIRLDQFDKSKFSRGRPRWFEVLWIVAKCTIVQSTVPYPSAVRRVILRMFGAKIGKGVVFRPRLNVHFPWKLEIGDHCWIGDGCQILSLERIVLETQVALGHEVYLAAGNHDIRSATMESKNRPITIRSGSWIASRAFIGPGVEIGEDVVVGAGAVIVRDVEPGVIIAGNPAKVVRERLIDRS